MKKTKKITKKSIFADILRHDPKAAEILFEVGLYCVGCPAAMYEPLEQGCLAHGLTQDEIKELVRKLNDKSKKK